MQYFTRRETVILTRTDCKRLTYLARTGVVVPARNQDAAGDVYYSWNQILELRTIYRLRRQVSLQTIRKILAFLEGIGSDRALYNKHLIIADGEVTWLKAGEDAIPQAVQIATKANRHVGQIRLMSPFSLQDKEFKSDLWRTSPQSKVVDFENFRQRILPLQPD
ncbi:MerR family transcriptional regulator [Oscillatoria sp. CS-180]|uniref:MerR family transcriptional regulator n=1 Tax=Oscillatoria sp. CS-180 TaxID=3021720 RepID=UPI00232CCA3F|nr:MerR family transcriptional regulator [Oscillatoria sp. CS-180]MDB9524865.1 MerR family transcriptional regulator [Oscillatoria sp. CS-180]